MPSRSTGSLELMKEMNRGLILNAIRERGPLSRVDIAKQTALHASTVTRIVADLIEEGMVREQGAGENHIGRKPILLDLVADARFFVGLSIEASSITGVITNLNAEIKARYHRQLDGVSKEDIVRQAKEAMDYLIDDFGPQRSKITSIGVAAHGIVDSVRGVILHPPAFGWRRLELADALREAYQLPVKVENNCNAMALGQFWFGKSPGTHNLLALKVGTGVGSGLIVNGSLFWGEDFSAGEIGHTMVAFDGPRCGCGKYGCLESVASIAALLEQARNRMKRGLTSVMTQLVQGNINDLQFDHLVAAANQGDDMALQIFREAGAYLGVAIANTINMINPSRVLVGGDVFEALPHILPTIEEVVASRSMEIPGRNVRIEPVRFGVDAVVMGAVVLVMRDVFYWDEQFA